ncbi:threonine-phosphate decarboxylase [Methanohalophilus levihalophilus]|uniref:threonine-phosphate decarboxylase CobD n=1 Tax=Methanohalophilus levihalophilus TaxID=1431282 RepID=UPI001AE991F2|nr:threonine-phosphate decarboxylase CobD [Methanohalophilus levihalophilus]MBP2030158.1 threonine-phosphate decarboxylase [Methanohalophilus levihalophilus]
MLPLKENILALTPPSHGGLIRHASQLYSIPEDEILDMSASLNPLGTPFDHAEYGMDLDSILAAAFERIGQYPDNRYIEFREAAAEFVGNGVTKDCIIPGNGSTEIIRLVAECILGPEDSVIIPQPTFAEYGQQCSITGAKVLSYPVDDILNIPDEMLAEAKIIFVCNPNNPTGKLIPSEKILELASRCEANETLLYVDEAFIELSDISQTVVGEVPKSNYLFVMRSLTKCFAIPGIRMGFGVASKEMADLLNAARLSWNMGAVAEEMSCALLRMEGGLKSPYLMRSRAFVDMARTYLADRLSDIYGFIPLPSEVNYVLVNISNLLMDSTELSTRLASHGVLIRDCSSFPTMEKDYIRIAVRPPEETDRLVYAIGEVLTESGIDYGAEQLRENIQSAVSGKKAARNTCDYYPCHFHGQDCTFCFCPFYPCENTKTGGKWIESTTGSEVWSCEGCTIIHKPELSQQMLEILMDDGGSEESLKKAWDEIIVPIL